MEFGPPGTPAHNAIWGEKYLGGGAGLLLLNSLI